MAPVIHRSESSAVRHSLPHASPTRKNSPASTSATGPLVMTARLRSTYDTYCSRGRFRSAATSANAIAPKRNTVNTMSNTPMLPSRNVSGSVASISHARTPIASSNNCAPVQRVIQKSAIAAIALGRRMAACVSPSAAMARPCSQWKRTGLSMYGRPSSSGIIQLPARSISRVSCA